MGPSARHRTIAILALGPIREPANDGCVKSSMHLQSIVSFALLCLAGVSGFSPAPAAGADAPSPWAAVEVVWLGEQPANGIDSERVVKQLTPLRDPQAFGGFGVAQIVIDPRGRFVAASYYRNPINRPGTDWDAWVVVWDLQQSKRWVIPDAFHVFDVSMKGAVLLSRYKGRTTMRPKVEELVLWDSNSRQTHLLRWKEQEAEAEAGPDHVAPNRPHAARFSELEYVVAVQGDGHVVRYETQRQTGLPTDGAPVVVDQVSGATGDVWLVMPRQTVMLMAKVEGEMAVVSYVHESRTRRLVARSVYGLDRPTVPGEVDAAKLHGIMDGLTHFGRGERVMVPAYWLHGMTPEGPVQTLMPLASAQGQCMAWGESADVVIRHRKADAAWRLENPDQRARTAPAYALSYDGAWFLTASKQTDIQVLDATNGERLRVLPYPMER